jgi:MFS family permease
MALRVRDTIQKDHTERPPGERSRVKAYAAFRSRSYQFLLGGSVLSSLSQQMLSIVVGWDLYKATHSPVVLGNVGLVQIVPVLLFSLSAGQMVDRYDRRSMTIFSQCLIVIAALLLVFLGTYRGVTLIYACLFLVSTGRAFQMPASSALLPHVIPPEHLTNALTWNASGREMATVVGPALAGGLLALLGSTSVYIASGACALLTLACFFAVKVPEAASRAPEASEKAPASDKGKIGDGVRFVFREKVVLSALTLDLLAVLFGGATALLPIYATDILRIGATGLGWLRAAPAVGAATMALAQAHMPPIRRAGAVLLLSVAGFGAATIGFGVSTSAVLSFALLVAIGALDNISVVLRTYLVQTRTPDELRGRVFAVNSLFINCSNQWGAVESGLAAAWLGTVASVAWNGAATLAVVGVVAAVSVQLRSWRN